MAFRRATGRTKLLEFPKAAAVITLEAGDLVQLSADGQVNRWASDTAALVVGVCRETLTDTGTGAVKIEVPTELFVEWEFDTDSDGGLADSDVGRFVDVDTNSDVDVSASTEDTVYVTKRISATKGRGVFARTPLNKAGGTIA